MLSDLYELVFAALGPFCHQLPERSWFVLGVQLPLCARCTALTLGAAAAAVYLVGRWRRPAVGTSLLLAAPMLVELALQELGLLAGTNALRAATGALFGFFGLLGGLGAAAAWAGPGRVSRAPCRRAV